jgi:hypothetical protein
MRIGIALCLLGLLSSCASAGYYKPGGTAQEFYKAKTSCRVQLQQSGQRTRYQYIADQFFEECMAGEGWRLGEPEEPSLAAQLEAAKRH